MKRILKMVLAVLVLGLFTCCSSEPSRAVLDLEFEQRFEGLGIRLGNAGQISGTFDGAITMYVTGDSFTGSIVTLSEGFYFGGLPLPENTRAEIGGTVERYSTYCFEAFVVTDLPLDASMIGCQDDPEVYLVVMSGGEIECSTLDAVDPIHTYFGGE